MQTDFAQIVWDEACERALRELLALAIREDLGSENDWTTRSLVADDATGQAAVVSRQTGVIAGMAAAEMVLAEFDPQLCWTAEIADGEPIAPGTRVGEIQGPARSLLTAERTLLNLLGQLSGVASMTRLYVDAVSGTRAKIYDTRKTTLGWRHLEKYAVHVGGGRNHRLGLHTAILIKDNHLALAASGARGKRLTPAEAVTAAQAFAESLGSQSQQLQPIIEVEVDSLDQLAGVLPVHPDLVLLDNMPPETLRQAVEMRNRLAPGVELEASGGINLQTVRAVAETGVERISSGALTHGSTWLDLGLDWLS